MRSVDSWASSASALPSQGGDAEDDLAGLDVTDLPQHRLTPTQRGVDTDIPALRARSDEAHQHAHQLADAIRKS